MILAKMKRYSLITHALNQIYRETNRISLNKENTTPEEWNPKSQNQKKKK